MSAPPLILWLELEVVAEPDGCREGHGIDYDAGVLFGGYYFQWHTFAACYACDNFSTKLLIWW